MIVNPLVIAAAAASRAIGNILPDYHRPTTAARSNSNNSNRRRRHPNDHFGRVDAPNEPSSSSAFPHTNQYLVDIEDNLYSQACELDEFMTTSSGNVDVVPAGEVDVQIFGKETNSSDGEDSATATPKQPPPPLPNTSNPWMLLGLERGAAFKDVRRAYKQLVKKYHPDVVVGPDATPEERKNANWSFARINAAFDILKRKENEEVVEYSVYIDGQKVRKSVVLSDHDGSYNSHREHDPHRINYDRIIEMAEYRKRRPRKRTWYEQDHEYNVRNDSYSVNAHSKGKWWITKDYHERDGTAHHYATGNFGYGGPVKSNEKMWEERYTHEVGERHKSGFGYNPAQDQWWNGKSAFDEYNNSYNGYHRPRNGQGFEERKEGYPYKDRRWNSIGGYDEIDGSSQYEPNFDYHDRYPTKDKWWRSDETTSGEFSP